MTLTIDLPDEEVAALTARARVHGLPLEQYARLVLEQNLKAAQRCGRSRKRSARSGAICPPTYAPNCPTTEPVRSIIMFMGCLIRAQVAAILRSRVALYSNLPIATFELTDSAERSAITCPYKESSPSRTDTPMTITIELPPEIEAGLLAEAETEGLPLPQYVQRLLLNHFPLGASTAMSPQDRAAAWRESVNGLPQTPPLSDQAISRESIYADRGR